MTDVRTADASVGVDFVVERGPIATVIAELRALHARPDGARHADQANRLDPISSVWYHEGDDRHSDNNRVEETPAARKERA